METDVCKMEKSTVYKGNYHNPKNFQLLFYLSYTFIKNCVSSFQIWRKFYNILL